MGSLFCFENSPALTVVPLPFVGISAIYTTALSVAGIEVSEWERWHCLTARPTAVGRARYLSIT